MSGNEPGGSGTPSRVGGGTLEECFRGKRLGN